MEKPKVEEIATKPLVEGGHPFVYTKEKKVLPFSFFDERCFTQPKAEDEKKNSITPTYLTLEELNKPKVLNETTIFDGFER